MLKALLFLLLIGALTALTVSLLRRKPRHAQESAKQLSADPTALLPALDLPIAVALTHDEVFRKLRELALGAAVQRRIPAEHAKLLPAIAGALETAATEPRYAPRRPLLLPKLLSAVSDNETSRGELVQIISRDPSLVGSLLKLANSPFYRANAQPIESVDRAIAVMGTEGIRSLIAAALIQPVFRTGAGDSNKFPEIVWEHTSAAAAAAEVHAATVEGSDQFAAHLLALVTGLGAIVVFRVALDQYALRAPLPPDATTIAALLDSHTPSVARSIAASWELSDRILEALEQRKPSSPEGDSALGLSLGFGRLAGALAVLKANEIIDEDTAVATLEAGGGAGPRFTRLWARLTDKTADDARR